MPEPNTKSLHESYTSLYGEYKEQIYQQAVYLTSCPHNAEDIVQDVFLNLWKHKDRWKEIENFQAYLFFCTRNRAMDYFEAIKLERTNVLKWNEEQLLYDSPEQKLESLETQRIHEQAVQLLPAQQRKVYTLRRLYGWKRKKIAGELNISDDTVKAHMQSAIRSVKKFMITQTGAEDVMPERSKAFRSPGKFFEY